MTAMSNEKIIDAIVFNDRAIVTKMVELDIEKGESEYIFKNIPQNVIRESIRAKGSGDFIIIGFDIYDEFLTEYNREEINKLKTKLDELNLQVSKIKNKLSAVDSLGQFLDNLNFQEVKLITSGEINKIDSGELNFLIKFLDKNMDMLDNNELDLNIELQKLMDKVTKINHDLEKLNAGNSLNILNCKIKFSSENQISAKIILSYAIFGASWTPLYDARLDYEKRIMQITYFAQTSQSTGENWDNVDISFSTANPQTGAFLPDLQPWFIDFYYPPPATAFKNKKMRSVKKMAKMEEKKELERREDEEEMDDFIEDLAPEIQAEIGDIDESYASKSPDESVINQADIQASGLNITFKALNTQTINSDGTIKKSVILIDNFKVKLKYIIIPKLSENAFLKSILINDKSYPLLAGNVNVYHDNNFAGASTLDTIAPGKEFELYMGIDPGVDVKYKLINKFTQTTGLTNKINKITYKYKIIITNFKNKEEEINLFERIPVSSDKDIKVKIECLDIFSEPDVKGILKAVFIIKPGEKREIDFSYSVEAPKDKQITGLE